MSAASAQGALFDWPEPPPAAGPDLASYDRVVVAFSGGKDSVACVAAVLRAGVRPEIVELWHHAVDGREGSRLMDWPVTPAYCRAFAAAFGLPLYESWRHGGIEGEMLRVEAPAAPVSFETPDGLATRGGSSPRLVTRLRFPQTASATNGRWCSAAVKIDVGNVALRNQPRFERSRTLFVTGERAAESGPRARMSTFGPHDCDLRHNPRVRRHVDHWRPVHALSDDEVWAVMEAERVAPHPAYGLGVGRVSCKGCVFADASQWRTLRDLAPAEFSPIAAHERRFGHTMREGVTLEAYAASGTAYPEATPELMAACLSERFDGPILLPPGAWRRPPGADRRSGGPT